MKTFEDIKRDGWQSGINEVWFGDCLEMLSLISSNSVDLIITDPPYGLNFRSVWPSENKKKDFIKNDKLEEFVPLIQKVIPQLIRVMKENSEIYWFCGGGGGGSPISAIAWLEFKKFEPELRVKNVLVWDKMWPGLGWDWRFQYETIFQLVKGRGIDNNDSSAVNIIRAKKIIPQEGEHPTPKSEEVIWELMKRKSKEGDLILDPFNGGGATTYTAKVHKRNYIGIEIIERYVKIAEDRLKQEILL